MTETRSPRGPVLPIYVAVDESASMTPQLPELNEGLGVLYRTLLGEPMAAAKVRFAVLGFAEDVVEHLVLTDLRTLERMPRVSTRGSTSYGAAFDRLAELIPHDVAALKAQGHTVHRPAVFLMSDGQPNDDWRPAYARLTDREVTRAAPNIIACGVGEADAGIMVEVATQPEFAFVAGSPDELGQDIAEFFSALTRSVVASGNSLGTELPELVVERPDGFRLAIDEI